MGPNNRTEEGDGLVASGMKLPGFVEAGVGPVGCRLLSSMSLDSWA